MRTAVGRRRRVPDGRVWVVSKTASSRSLKLAVGSEHRPTVHDAAGAGSHPAVARLSLLGGFELRVQGELVRLPHAAERLISFLALHPHALMRVFVAGTLWGEASESRSCSSLRSLLWHVRARTPVIHATSTHLSLAPEVDIDVVTCADLVARLRDNDAPPSASELHALCEAGELLPDWYDDWLLIERERLRQRRLHCLETASRRLSAAGRHAEAIEAGLCAIAVEPLRETGHIAVIAAHLAEGNLIEASRQYEQLRDLLRENLGTVPSAHIRTLLRDGHVKAA
jgi:DNA-binding SARP family transcriptional activator